VRLPRLYLCREFHHHSCLNSEWFLRCLQLSKLCALKCRGSSWFIKLHNLSSFSSCWVISQSLPFETSFCECSFYLWISLYLTRCICLVIKFKSNVLTVDILPNKFNDLIDRSLNFAWIDRRKMADVASVLSLRCVVYIYESHTQCISPSRCC
jgi:hypothetical protein